MEALEIAMAEIVNVVRGYERGEIKSWEALDSIDRVIDDLKEEFNVVS